MTLQADHLVDRRRLKRSVTFWRVLAIVAGLALIAVLVLRSEKIAASIGLRPHIARIKISGLIREDYDREKMLKKVAESNNVKAVILRINSPGGTTVGGESLHQALLDLRKEKPVVAVFSTVAASAAYMAGVAADHIVARGSSITGSVGVILQWAEVTDMLEKLGVKMEEVRSGELKAVPSPFRPIDEPGRELVAEMVSDAKTWFIDLVAERRSLDPVSVPGLTEGRIYSGRQALEYKLVDQIGGEKEAIAWLEKERQVPADLKVIEWEPEDSDGLGMLGALARSLLAWTGLPASVSGAVFGPGNALERVRLDGLVSVWHAQDQR